MPLPSATEERNISMAPTVAAGSGLSCLGLCSPICRGRILAAWYRVTFYNETSWSFVQAREARRVARFYHGSGEFVGMCM